MRATFFGLEIARSALHISQKQLDVTGHNIANVDTPGYSRQRIDTASIDPMSGTTFLKNLERGRVGGGVDALTTSQIRDIYLDWQYRVQASTTGQWTSRYDCMYRIESMFNETEDTKFANFINEFYSAISKVGNDYTESPGVRSAAVGATNSLTNFFALKYSTFQEQLIYEDKAIKTKAERVNTIAESIAVLNDKIHKYEFSTKEKANDLRDKRNLLLDELSTLVDVDYGEETINGDPENVHFWVTLGGDPSHRLVDHTLTDTIKIDKGGLNQYVAMEVDRLTEKIANYNAAIASGTLSTEQEVDAMNQRAKLAEELTAYIEQLGGVAKVTYNGVELVPGQLPIALADPTALSGNLKIELAADPLNPTTSSYGIMVDSTLAVNQLKDVGTANITSLKDAYDVYQLTWDSDQALVSVKNGAIYGHMVMRDGGDSTNNGLPYYMFRLNEYVRTLAGEFNAIHERGYTMPYSQDGTDYPSTTGISYFVSKGGGPITAGSIMLNEIINKNANNIAVSSVMIDPNDTSPEPGDTEIGKELYRMLDKSTKEDGLLFDGLWGKIMADIGKDAEYALNTITVNERVSDTLQNRRLSVMGVSIEEEMTNLIRFNHAYSAASRLVTVLDEALDKLINGTGRVGL